MFRSHLAQVLGDLARPRGYRFIAATDDNSAPLIDSWPAARLAPPRVQRVEGRRHGRIVYAVTLLLCDLGARLSPAARAERLLRMEEDALALFADLSADERVVEVTELGIRPSAMARTAQGEIGQTAEAKVTVWF